MSLSLLLFWPLTVSEVAISCEVSIIKSKSPKLY